MDINSGWGKFSKTAFLTYFVNIPALLGLFLLWGNKKRHVIWIISGSLIIFLSAGWEPIYRLALPMIAIMMPLGWAAYFVVLRTILKLIKSVEQRVEGLWRRVWSIELNGNLERKRQEAVAFVGEIASLVKKTISLEIVSGLLVCCLAMPVVILSAENVSSAVKRSGYPYRDGDEEWMDMGVWLRLYAPPDSITMTRNPWELHFYSNQLAVQIPRASLEKTIEVIRYYKPTYIIPQLDIRPSLKPLVEGKVPGLELVYDNKKLQLYKIRYDLLP